MLKNWVERLDSKSMAYKTTVGPASLVSFVAHI